MEKFDFTVQPGRKLLRRFEIQKPRALVTVVTPYYNTKETFIQMYQSLANQTFPWCEWILVDDGSTSRPSLEQLERVADQEVRARVFHVANQGPAAARNFGISQAKTDYIVFIDSDDMVEPTFLECLYIALQQNPKAAWAYADVVTIGAREFLWKQNFSSATMKKENLLTVMAMIRRSVLEEVGCFDVMGRYYNEDWHLWLKILAKGHFPVHVEQYLAWYRNKEQGAMASLNRNAEMVKKNAEKIAEIARQVPDDIYAVTYHAVKEKLFEDIRPWNWAEPLPMAKKKTRILFLVPHMVMGGADRFNLDLIARSDPERFEFTLVTTINSPNEWLQKFTPSAEVFLLPTMMDKSQWPAFYDYLIRTRQIDIVFNTNSYYSYYTLPWLHLRHPQVAFVDYIHNEEWYYRNGGFARPSGAIGAFLDKTYTCNGSTGRALVKHFRRDPASVQTVYIGVDEEKFDPAQASAEDVPEKYRRMGQGKTKVIFPCRICTQKRPFLMLEIAAKMPDCVFFVIGDGPQYEELVELTKRRGLEDRVIFTGRQEEMRPWYLFADITLLCSLKEGLALTAYESRAMGTPVVTADVGGQAELVNSHVGRVLPLLQDEGKDEDNRDFDPEEIDQYVRAIHELVDDPAVYRQVADACRPHVCNGFTVSNMVDNMAHIFEELASADARAARSARISALQQLEPMAEALCDIWGNFEELDGALQYYVGQYHNLAARCQQAEAELYAVHHSRTHRLADKYQQLVNRSFLKDVRGFLGKVKRMGRS